MRRNWTTEIRLELSYNDRVVICGEDKNAEVRIAQVIQESRQGRRGEGKRPRRPYSVFRYLFKTHVDTLIRAWGLSVDHASTTPKRRW